MTAVGPQGKGGVPQVAQVADDLAIGRTTEVGLVQDGLLQLGVGDLALRHGSSDSNRTQENGREDNSRWFHIPLQSCGRCRLSAGEAGRGGRVRMQARILQSGGRRSGERCNVIVDWQHDDLGADVDPAVEIDHIRIEHPNTTA